MSNEQVEALAQQLKQSNLSDEARISILNTLAWELRRTNLPEAINLTKEAYQLALLQNDIVALAVCNGHLARFFHYQTNPQRALNYANAALALFDEIEVYNTPYLQTLHTLAIIYNDLSQYKDAFEIFVRILDSVQDTTDLYHQCIAYNGLAGIHSRFSNRDDALENYELAYNLSVQNDDAHMQGVIHRNLAMEYGFLHQHSRAIQHAEEALNLFTQTDNTEQIVRVELILSNIYLNMVNYELAEVLLQQVLGEITRLDEYRQKYGVETLLNLCKVKVAQEDYVSALIYAQDAHDQALATDKTERIYECHEQFANIYKKQGQYKQALYHFEQFHNRRDAVLHQDQLAAIHNFNIMYQVERARKEADFYKRLREQDRKHHEHIAQMKDELLHTASHDLKNPLMTMISYLHLLEKQLETPDADTQRYLNVVKSQVDQMRDLIGDVLDLAVLETQVLAGNEQTELQSAIENIIHIVTPQIEERQQHLEWTLPDATVYLAVDDARLTQILRNLLTNAIKYTPTGGTIALNAHCNGHNNILIKIKDTGWGIPADDIPYIFEKFYRSNSIQTAQSEGTGLGLAIVKRIVEQYDGTIDVQSEVGQGSEFTLSFPLYTNGDTAYSS